MKKLKIMLASILGLTMTAAVTTASAEETDKPVLSGSTIICGGKTVKLDPDGRIEVSNANGILLWTNPFFCYMNDQKAVDWNSFTKSECKVKTENGKVVWSLKKKLGDKIYDAGTQTLEITSEGLLKVQYKLQVISIPGWQPRTKYGNIFINTPYAQSEGKDVVFNGKRCKMTVSEKQIFVNWRDKQFKYVFYPDNADNTLTVNAVQPEIGRVTGCSPDKWTKSFRTTLATVEDNSCTFTLDIRKGASGK